MSMIEIAERRGEIPALVKCLDAYTFILNTFASAGQEISGEDFAVEIARHFYTGDDTTEGRRNALMAAVAEKYVIAVTVRRDGACTFRLPEAIAKAIAA